MAAYNAESTVNDAVASVLAQTVTELELVVVDDGSDAPLAEVLADVHDTRLRLIRHERNRGLSAARNTALSVAETPFVSQLDADDLWEPDYLAHVLPRFDDPTVGLVYTNALIIGHPQGHSDYIGDPSVHPLDRFPKFADANPVPALTATMRTDAVRAVGGYARWLWATQDYHLYAKLIAAGWRFAYVHRQLARYRWPSEASGMSHDRHRHESDELKMWLGFVARHPLVPGPRRQVRVRLKRRFSARAPRRPTRA